jgi:branched-chain amino acid transport system substrate-binding protein
MKQSKHTRRFFNLVAFASVVAMAGAGGIVAARAQQKAVKLGITLPLTGADADDSRSPSTRPMPRVASAATRSRS